MSTQGTAFIGKERNYMALTDYQKYTIEDIYNLPEDVRVELIDGKIYNMTAPRRIHQEILISICTTIYNHIHEKHRECKVYPAPFAVRLIKDEQTLVEPDISVICDKDKLDDKGCNGAPDWIIEVISPSSRNMDYFVKMFKYREAGVREYWIVEPEKNRILVYAFEKEDIREYSFNDRVTSEIFSDLFIDFSEFISVEEDSHFYKW